MKKFMQKTMLLLCALIAGSSNVWANEYSYTFTSKVWTGNGSATLGDVSWTLNMVGGVISDFSYDGGMKFGTGGDPCNSVSISTSGISGTITSVAVVCSRGNGLVGNLSVTVGGENFKVNDSETASLTTSNATYDFTGSGSGAIDIAWKKESGSGSYYIKSISVTYSTEDEPTVVNINGVTLNKSTMSIVYGNTDNSLEATVTPSNATNKALSWSSSNESVATVDESGEVTAHAVGTTTITVTTEDQGKTARCEVTVTPNTTKPYFFKETFEDVTGNGVANVNDFDVPGWTKTGSVYANYGNGIRLATGKEGGSVTTPALAISSPTATLTFKVSGRSDTENSISLNGTNCTLSESSFTDLPTTLTKKTITVTVTGSNPKITFSTDANKRAYIDDIFIIEPNIDIKLSSTGYASYCSLFALDLTPTEDYEAWAVTATSGDAVTFTKIPGKVPANTPFILYNSSKAGESVSVPVIDDDDAGIATVAGNMLRGTISPTYVSTVNGDYTNFGLSGGNFLKINDGVVKANKAYLPVLTSALPSDARLTIIFNDETTGVYEVRSKVEDIRAPYYDLQGRKVSQPRKGLYIVNGKKTLIK